MMVLSYPVRVLCLGLAAGYLLHAALMLAARLLSPALRRRTERMAPLPAARRVLAWRSAPLILSAALTAGVVLPVYLHFEPVGQPEDVSLAFVLAAGFGAAAAALALLRWARAALALRRLERACQRSGRALAAETALPVCAVRSADPFMVLAGVRHPRVVVSTAALERLTPPQLAAALRHEQAHQAAGDRWWRALLLLLPDVLPGCRWRAMDDLWARYAEWTADQAAAGGEPSRALDLAEALLAVSRGAAPRVAPLGALVTGLASGGQELAARVGRLLATRVEASRCESPGGVPSHPATAWRWPAALAALLAATALLTLPHAAALYPYLERLVR